jgi:hypothetical protein
MREPECDSSRYTGPIFVLLVAAIVYMLVGVVWRLSHEAPQVSPIVPSAPAAQPSRRRPLFPWFPRKEYYEDGK